MYTAIDDVFVFGVFAWLGSIFVVAESIEATFTVQVARLSI